ncbi:phosphotransferase [Actinopolymorpha sp. B17G11]|uniref:phosphotransferase enzyme family protein n=1 Tax=Actinopolymorpha sp. B17G11 TaxID=3160861 RepID=UPI0032E40820
MRVVSSLLHPDDLARLVEREYDVAGPVVARLLRRGFNDTYLVADSAGERRILRIYSRDKYWVRSADDLLFELELLNHLASAGCPVSHPYPRRRGDLLGELEAPEGERHFALFTFAPGVPPGEDGSLGIERARALGTEIARLHVAMDEFGSPRHRYHLDLERLVDMALTAIAEHVGPHQQASYAELCTLTERLKAYITRLDLPEHAYGLIHGDLYGGNIHLTSAGEFAVFDFDHCGFGWRAYDLTNFYPRQDSSDAKREAWSAIAAGYASVRAWSEAEQRAMPAFAACRELWDVGDWLGAAHWAGHDVAPERLSQRALDRVRRALGSFRWEG